MQAPNSASNTQQSPVHWLDRYGCGYHQWQKLSRSHGDFYYRPLGVVEGFFDTDGTEFEGRADVNSYHTIEIRTSLTGGGFRERLLLIWAVFRYQHVLVSSRATAGKSFLPASILTSALEQRYFLFEQKSNLDELLQDARHHITFLEDTYKEVDSVDFYHHLANTSRVIDPEKALAKLFVLPLKPGINGTQFLQLIMVAAHQITDGLTTYRWQSHLIDLLNLDRETLLEHARLLLSMDLEDRLPKAQEDLYQPLQGSQALKHWKWAIARILRHIRRPPSASFQNPLRRVISLKQAQAMNPTYSAVIDYSTVPPLNTLVLQWEFSPNISKRLSSMCRGAGISLGAGVFALVGIVMMLFYENDEPNLPLDRRLPFVGSFPVNPRPFFREPLTTGKEDSLMLAFSDGLTLPFLPSHLPVDGRLKLLGRLAHKQLSQFQKRTRGMPEQVRLSSNIPSQLIPALYIGSVERMEAKALPHLKTGINPQGAYPASQSTTLATCGVSSVGDRTSLINAGKYDVDDSSTSKDLVADFRNLQAVVRVRDGEFLVGSSGDKKTLGFHVSYDGNAIDPEKAAAWQKVMESILELDEGNMRSRL